MIESTGVLAQMVASSFRSLRVGLDEIVVGYGELKDALVCALFRRALGLKGHLLVFSAPGLAKTTLIKGASKLVAQMNGGGCVAYDRVQGRSDLTPEEFLSRRRSEYDGEGRLQFVNALQTVRSFLASEVTGLPGFWHFDEIDKVPARAQFGLLQVMEEQQVSVEGLGTQDLNFSLFATANTKKYDPSAQPIPISVKDRFTSVVELGFLPLDADVEVLRQIGTGAKRAFPAVKRCQPTDLLDLRSRVAEQGLGKLVSISDQIIRGCATVTKLTQTKLPEFTDFSGKFKVAAGPRSYIDLLQEAAAASILSGSEVITPETCIRVGCRVYRGRVEVTPDVTMNGETADTVITKILHEVFGGMTIFTAPPAGGSGSGDPSVASEEDGSDPAQSDESPPDASQEADDGEKSGESSAQNPQTQDEESLGQENEEYEAGEGPAEAKKGEQGGSDSPSPSPSLQGRGMKQGGLSSQNGAEDSDFLRESFCADMRRESRKPQGPQGKEGSDGKSPEGPEGQEGTGPEGGEQKNPAKEPGRSKAVVKTESLAKLLGSDPTREFQTAEGIKTAAEIAQELANAGGQARFDLKALDGSFEAKVRGQKSIVQSEKPEVVREAAELNEPSPEMGKATSSGSLAGKGDSLPEIGNVTVDIPQELIKMMPLLRGLTGEKRIELLEKWTSIPPQHRVRGGPEYRLLKGMAHLSALKAISQFDEVEEGAQTMSRAGEQVDFLRGQHFEAPLDELRTMEETLASGGAVDDLAEIRQKRVSTDAPNLMFVMDTSGSMGCEGRLQSAMAASQATALFYGPRGATFGLTVFADHPASVVPSPEADVDVVIDGILMLQPSFGTSYARGLELAIRQALPNTTIMVFGDFLDSGFPAPEVYAIAHDKCVKVVGIVSVAGNSAYAAELCDEVYTVSSWDDPSAVALVALKAAQ